MEEKDFQTLATELKAKIDAKELSVNEEIKAVKALYDAQQAELKELTLKNNKLNVLTEKSKTFNDVVSETLNSEDYKKYATSAKGKSYTIDLDTKSVLLSSVSNNTEFVAGERIPGIVTPQYETTHLRDLIPVMPTNSNHIVWVQRTSKNGAYSAQTEGYKKAVIDYNYTVQTSAVQTIAGFTKLSNQMLADAPFVSTSVQYEGVELLKEEEDRQVLYGQGAGNSELTGVLNNCTAFKFTGSTLSGLYTSSAPLNAKDVFIAGLLQLRQKRYKASSILVSPLVYYKLQMSKNTLGSYIFDRGDESASLLVNGVTITEHTAIADNDFIIADFVKGAVIYDRMQSRVDFGEEMDDFTKNLSTIRVEQRVGFAIKDPNAIIKGQFSTVGL